MCQCGTSPQTVCTCMLDLKRVVHGLLIQMLSLNSSKLTHMLYVRPARNQSFRSNMHPSITSGRLQHEKGRQQSDESSLHCQCRDVGLSIAMAQGSWLRLQLLSQQDQLRLACRACCQVCQQPVKATEAMVGKAVHQQGSLIS